VEWHSKIAPQQSENDEENANCLLKVEKIEGKSADKHSDEHRSECISLISFEWSCSSAQCGSDAEEASAGQHH